MSAYCRGFKTLVSDKLGLSTVEYGLFAALLVGAILLTKALLNAS